jgi:hypothetical protein
MTEVRSIGQGDECVKHKSITYEDLDAPLQHAHVSPSAQLKRHLTEHLQAPKSHHQQGQGF